MAAAIKARIGADVTLEAGDRGEFTVWVDRIRVASKGLFGFPDDDVIVEAAERELERRKSTPKIR